MPLDINGYNISNLSGLMLGLSNTKILAANYGIREPLLPGMLGSATANNAYKIYPFQVNDVNLNTGSPWSTSTFRFTAPVAGVYYTSYSGICGLGSATASQAYYSVVVNGTNYAFSYRDTVNVWELHHVELMVNLAANDWIAWAMNIAPAPDSSLTSGSYSANHNTCTIWLVG